LQHSTRERKGARHAVRVTRDASRWWEQPGRAAPARSETSEHARGGWGLGERGLGVRVALTLVLANARYWTSVAPLVHVELRRWSRRASAIPEENVREVALSKLRREHFNAEVAATLATLAPASRRDRVVAAIVAFEVLYDYLDGLSELRGELSLQSGRDLYAPFVAVFEQPAGGERLSAEEVAESFDDGGYLQELADTARLALAGLPAARAVAAAGRRAAQRCAEAQIRVHAKPRLSEEELERWALKSGSDYELLSWRDYTAGAVASVLAAHALIATAAEAATEQQADAIDAAYLTISALSTMLDSLVDYGSDVAAGDPWLLRLYGDRQLLSERLSEVAAGAVAQARQLPHAAHHLMTLLGVVAYYTSAPEAREPEVREVVARLHRELRPLVLPTLLVMRCWRMAKWIRHPRGRSGRGSDGRDGC
jgi:tetraprenyl-beta-curcumene synthase